MTTSNFRVSKVDKFLSYTFLKILPKWITPNHITIFRFLTIPFVLWLLVTEYYTGALILFAISAFSDALDGALARTTNQITDWGKMFDPLADKLLIGVVAVLLIPKFASSYLALAIIAIESIILLSAYYKKRYLGANIEAQKLGKFKMIIQSLGLGLLLVYAIFSIPIVLSVGVYMLYLSVVLAVVSAFSYNSI